MFTRHTSPATRKARRDLIAAQAELLATRGTNPRFRLTPSAIAALVISTALALVGWVEALPF